jgi:hypothetical protein
MGASAQNGQLSGSRNCGWAANQALSDGAALIERAFADCDDLKASVTAVVVILVGEASGLLPRKGLGFIETRLKVGADGRIAVDAADPFPFSDAVNLIGHGLASLSML